METKELTLRIGESQEIQLSSRGSSGLQLLFSAEPADVLSVVRRELGAQEREATSRVLGNAVPAHFILTGTRAGGTKVYFYEQPAAGRGGPQIPIVTYLVSVHP